MGLFRKKKAINKNQEKEKLASIEEAVTFMKEGQVDKAMPILEKYAREGNLVAVYYLAYAKMGIGKYSVALDYAKLVKENCADEEFRRNINSLIEEIQSRIVNEKEKKIEKVEKENDIRCEPTVSHSNLCLQYCDEMSSSSLPIGCGRELREEEIYQIVKSCKSAKELNLKFRDEIDDRELEEYLKGKDIAKERVLAFADHGEQGASFICKLAYKDGRNEHSFIYRNVNGKMKMFLIDVARISIYGAYMENNQVVVWDCNNVRESFDAGIIGPAIAELLQKLVIAFHGNKDYKKIQEEMNQRREREYQNKIDRAFREENPVQVKLTQGQIEIYPRITGASEHLREWVERERIRYIRKMAEAGNPEAMYVLAVGRVNGESIINNIHQSLELCKKAALAGCTEAMVYMGLCCVTRFMGYKGSSLEAIDWFSKAKSKGSVEAIRYLAICKYNGIGDGEWSADVRRSHAMHILESAVAKGDEEARKIYKIMDRCLRVRITEDDIWKRKNIVF